MADADVRCPDTGGRLEVEQLEREDKRIDFEAWLERAGCTGEEAARVRELLADRIEDGRLRLDRGIFKARKAG